MLALYKKKASKLRRGDIFRLVPNPATIGIRDRWYIVIRPPEGDSAHGFRLRFSSLRFRLNGTPYFFVSDYQSSASWTPEDQYSLVVEVAVNPSFIRGGGRYA